MPARGAEGGVEAGHVGREAGGPHVAEDGEGDREKAGMSGDAEEEGVVREGQRARGGGEEASRTCPS